MSNCKLVTQLVNILTQSITTVTSSMHCWLGSQVTGTMVYLISWYGLFLVAQSLLLLYLVFWAHINQANMPRQVVTEIITQWKRCHQTHCHHNWKFKTLSGKLPGYYACFHILKVKRCHSVGRLVETPQHRGPLWIIFIVSDNIVTIVQSLAYSPDKSWDK